MSNVFWIRRKLHQAPITMRVLLIGNEKCKGHFKSEMANTTLEQKCFKMCNTTSAAHSASLG